MVAGSLTLSLLLLLVHYLPAQEFSPRLMAVAGMDGQLLLLSGGVALFGAALMMGEIRKNPGSWFRYSAALLAVPWLAFFFVAHPILSGWTEPKPKGSGAQLSLLVQNLWYRNEDPEALAQQLLARNSQVMVLLEYTPSHAQAFQDAGVLNQYQYRWELVEPYGHGIAVFSSIPFINPQDLELSGSGVSMELQLPDSSVELFAVHFNAPTSVWDIPRWRSDFERATTILEQAGPRTVVAGDLNADWGHIRFRQLLAKADLRDAQDVRSVGFATTWPASEYFPTVLRLDHVLLGQGMELNSFERLPRNSSDHRGLLAGLSLLKPAP